MTCKQTQDLRESTTTTRRHLLHSAAGGFALAASGLILPDWLEETEAREGALGGAKGGRRGQDHRGRHKRRTHGDKKDKDKGKDKPRGLPTLPAIVVRNGRSVPVQTRGLQRETAYRNWYVPTGWDWEAIDAQFMPDQYSYKEFPGDFAQIVVQIGTDRVVRFDFNWPFNPDVQVLSGGWEWDGWRPKGETLVDYTTLAIGDSVSTPGIAAKRVDDANGHVWLQVTLT